jgi:NAD(P)-dependent dehydrogenase (short-subunit alcohol dehydrogenase family)
MAVHVFGSFNMTRAASPFMVACGHGRVALTTSAGVFGTPDQVAYCTAKASVLGLTRALALVYRCMASVAIGPQANGTRGKTGMKQHLLHRTLVRRDVLRLGVASSGLALVACDANQSRPAATTGPASAPTTAPTIAPTRAPTRRAKRAARAKQAIR